MAFNDLNRSLRSDPTYQAALRGEWGADQFPTGPDGRVLEGFRTMAARVYAEMKATGGTRSQDAVNQMYQGSKGSTIDPKTGEWSDPNATHWYDPQYVGPAVIGGIATGGIASAGIGAGAAGGAGGMSGLAPASYTVPSATLGAGGGMTGLATAGLAGSGYTVPAATLGANGGIPAGYGAGATATGTSLAERMGRRLGDAALIAGPAIVGRAMSGGGNGGGNAALPPELQQLLQMSMQRMTAQDPLFKSINAQAMAGLPTAYQRS